MPLEKPYKDLAGAIIEQALEDTETLYKSIVKIRRACTNPDDLYTYLYERKGKLAKNKYTKTAFLPFEDDVINDISAMRFWNNENKWAWTLLNALNIDDLPEKLLKKASIIKGYYSYCRPCIKKVSKRVNRDFRDEELEKILTQPREGEAAGDCKK